MSTLKLHYFDLPGRAENARLILTLGDVPFEDIKYSRDEWQAFKPKTPFGQLPVLETTDGKMLAESGAVDRFAAKLALLYPEDAWNAAQADQAWFFVNSLFELVYPSMKIQDAQEKIKARQDLVAGALGDKLKTLEKLLAGKEYVAANKLSFGDVAIFCSLSVLISGWLDGIPKDLLNAYPIVKAFRNKIASLDKVQKYYAKHTEGIYLAFKPDTA